MGLLYMYDRNSVTPYTRRQYNFTSGTSNPDTDFSPTNIHTNSIE